VSREAAKVAKKAAQSLLTGVCDMKVEIPIDDAADFPHGDAAISRVSYGSGRRTRLVAASPAALLTGTLERPGFFGQIANAPLSCRTPYTSILPCSDDVNTAKLAKCPDARSLRRARTGASAWRVTSVVCAYLVK
jgi:hypothetical protein